MRICICILALSAVFQSVVAKTATFTPSNGVLDPLAFANFTATAYTAGYDVLELTPGVYNVTPPSPSSPHLSLASLDNVTLDMQNTTLVFQNRHNAGIYVENFVNVTMSGPRVVYAIPPTNNARIVNISADEHQFTLSIPEGYPLEDWIAGASFPCNVFDPETRLIKAQTWDMSSNAINATADPRVFIVTYTNNYGPSYQNISVGDLLGCRQPHFGMTFQVANSENSTFESVTLSGGPGFGFFHSGSGVPGQRGNNTFRNCVIERPPLPAGGSEAPLLSTNADGFHCAGVPIGPRIENCNFQYMNDDGIAIHGVYSLVTTVNAGEMWVVTKDYIPGDYVRLYDATFTFVQELVVQSVANAAPTYQPPFNTSHTMPRQSLLPGEVTFLTLMFTTDIAPAAGFDWLISNANRTGNGFALINNYVGNHRARGMLIKGSRGVIQGNTINGSDMGGIIITPELYWGEADYAYDLAVVNNSIINVGYAMQGYGGLAIGAINPSNQLAGPTGFARLNVTGNTFSGVSYNNVWIASGTNITFVNNSIHNPFPFPTACCEPIPSAVVVYLTQLDNISIHNNCIYDPSQYVKSIYTVAANVSGTDLINGVQLCQ